MAKRRKGKAHIGTNKGPVRQSWPATQVQMKAIGELVPYARNARVHSEQQVGQIADSIRRWGFTMPVLVDENGMIIAGHGRVMAAKLLGLKEVPIVAATGWSEPEKRAYVLADNQIASKSTWDAELLGIELADLRDLDFVDLSDLGFQIGN
jgi:ParB-like chromosome segregation protein Spo0J